MKFDKKLWFLLVVPLIVFQYQFNFIGSKVNSFWNYDIISNLFLIAWLYLPSYYFVLTDKKMGYVAMWIIFALLFGIEVVYTSSFTYLICSIDLWVNLFFTGVFCVHKFRFKTESGRQDGLIKLTQLFYILMILLIVNAMVFKKITPSTTILVIIIMIVLFIWFILAFWDRIESAINKKYQEKLELSRIEELTKYNEEKLMMMKNIQNDIVATDHRLFYILYQLDIYLQNEEYDKAHELLKKYKELMTKYKIVVSTGNTIFDTLYSLKMNDFIMREKKVENSIFISENPFFNSFEFINFVCELLEYFIKCNTLYISMEEIDRSVILKIIYRDGYILEEQIEQYLKLHLNTNDSYNLTQHETKGVRVMVEMK